MEPDSVSREEFDVFLDTFDYITYDLTCGDTRYYKTINGYLTNDFYDVSDDDARITKSNNTISRSDIAEALQQKLVNSSYQAERSIVVDGISFGKLTAAEELTVYMKIGGKMIPVKIVCSDYQNDSGTCYQEITCINLLDNSLIDYADICIDA